MPTLLPRARLEALLAAAERQRVAVVGDAMLDVYLRGDVDRISPEAPVPVVRVRERKAALGLVPRVIVETIRMARARELPIVVDPKYRNFFAYRGATVFKPNRRELEAALGALVELGEPDALPDTLARLGVEHLLLTLGEQGM